MQSRKWWAAVAVLVLAFGLSACGDPAEPSTSAGDTAASDPAASDPAAESSSGRTHR